MIKNRRKISSLKFSKRIVGHTVDMDQMDNKESLAKDETSSKEFNLISDDQTVDISIFGTLILKIYENSTFRKRIIV